jgi:cysteinyl-tRNA synthetase
MNPIRLHDSLSRRKVAFVPLDPSNVRVYVCGPTVYDLAHLGNARSAVVFDQLRRVLEARWPRVTFVRNVTDVDDKIIARASETGEDIRALTTRTHAAYLQDMAALGVAKPTVEPRATEHLPHMIRMARTLIEKGHAYVSDGHVLFDVRANPRAGALSGHGLDDLRAGARVEFAPYKRDQADFVLWKPSDHGAPGWESPWGRGRPGWHIECSAMAAEHLGATFDIHGGGQDLMFPHHENELAQSTCAHGTDRMANVWMHNGMLLVDGKKMAKSRGNFVTVRDLLAEFPGRAEAIRLVLLSAHYRQPLDFTRARVREAVAVLDRFYSLVEDNDGTTESADRRVTEPLEDDLNVPGALAGLHALASDLASASGDEQSRLRRVLLASARALGLLEGDPAAWFRAGTYGPSSDEVERLIEARREARRLRDFAGADRIRSELAAAGVLLEDGKAGTTWRRA